ncbi:hypothetical protein LJC68_09705 [Bacteroidales bacterium OttesenSCG-928-B11]|nr:hypothetical protein [Bacteroidales bacterium OttesenSCG-928-B11]
MMKRVLFILIFCITSSVLFSQASDIKNPYRNSREEYLKAGREMLEEFDNRLCDNAIAIKWIEEYYDTYDYKYKKDLLYMLGRINCDTVTTFLVQLLLTDSCEETRCDAILLLGWRRPYELIPFFEKYATKDISCEEKIAVASLFAVMEDFQRTLLVLNRCCIKGKDMYEKCAILYFKTGNNSSSIDYFTSYLNYSYYKLSAASYLAKLGEYSEALPVFVETVTVHHSQSNDRFGNDNTSRMYVALMGLAMIGTNEAINIIESQCQHEEKDIAKCASSILQNLKKIGGEK